MQELRARSRRFESGFSLIELMISLVIIGVLATIAIPQFLGYRIRSAQTESKANLGAIRVAQVAFYAESGGYTDDLSQLAWRPEGTPRYLYGFVSDAHPAASGRNDTSELAGAWVVDYSTVNMRITPGIPLTEADLPGIAVATKQGFTVAAVANLDGDLTLDVVVMDQAGVGTIVTSDASQ